MSGVEQPPAQSVYDSKLFNYDMICDLIYEVENELNGGLTQYVALNNKLEALRIRYQRALRQNRKTAAYSLRLQIATVEGVKCMYTEYISRKHTKLDRLQSYSM